MLEPTEFAVTTHMYHMNTKPCVAGLTLFPRFNSSKIDAKSDVCSVHVAGVFQRIFSSALRKQPCQRSQNLQRVYCALLVVGGCYTQAGRRFMNVGERGGTGATKLTTKLTDCVDVPSAD